MSLFTEQDFDSTGFPPKTGPELILPRPAIVTYAGTRLWIHDQNWWAGRNAHLKRGDYVYHVHERTLWHYRGAGEFVAVQISVSEEKALFHLEGYKIDETIARNCL